MDIEMMKTTDVIPYEKNPRKNDEAVQYVKNSIKEFGFKVPIVVDKDHVVITGHTRLKAAKELELDEVPVIVAEDLTEEQVKAYRIADNKSSEKALWDQELLIPELDELEDFFDMKDFGFEDWELELEFEEEEEEEVTGEAQPDKEQSEVQIKDKFEILVTCKDERDLEATYEFLRERGIECRISV